MFKLFSRSKPATEIPAYRELQADMHSHLLPGIDDGSPDIETSLELIKGMMNLGYSRLNTTPHIMWDMYKNSRDRILGILELLREAISKEGLKVEVNGAAEYFLDDHVAGLVKNNEPLLTIKDNWVLVECSLAYPSNSLNAILFDMQMQ